MALPQASGCTVCDGTTNAPLPTWSGLTYPGNFGKGLGSGVLANVWQLSRSDIITWANQYDPLQPSDVSEVWSGEMQLKERDTAAYAMANLHGGAGAATSACAWCARTSRRRPTCRPTSTPTRPRWAPTTPTAPTCR